MPRKSILAFFLKTVSEEATTTKPISLPLKQMTEIWTTSKNSSLIDSDFTCVYNCYYYYYNFLKNNLSMNYHVILSFSLLIWCNFKFEYDNEE